MVITSTDADFQNHINTNKKVIVKFFADWCGSCKLFAPKYKRISNDEKYSDIVFLEVNAEENPETRKSAGVDNLPYFVIYKDGQKIDGSATSKEEFFISLLEKLN